MNILIDWGDGTKKTLMCNVKNMPFTKTLDKDTNYDGKIHPDLDFYFEKENTDTLASWYGTDPEQQFCSDGIHENPSDGEWIQHVITVAHKYRLPENEKVKIYTVKVYGNSYFYLGHGSGISHILYGNMKADNLTKRIVFDGTLGKYNLMQSSFKPHHNTSQSLITTDCFCGFAPRMLYITRDFNKKIFQNAIYWVNLFAYDYNLVQVKNFFNVFSSNI